MWIALIEKSSWEIDISLYTLLWFAPGYRKGDWLYKA